MLIAWIPAGWSSIPSSDVSFLRHLGFSLPTQEREERCALSEWKKRGLVQQQLQGVIRPRIRGVWPSGALAGQSVHHCLSSDEDEDVRQTPGFAFSDADVVIEID